MSRLARRPGPQRSQQRGGTTAGSRPPASGSRAACRSLFAATRTSHQPESGRGAHARRRGMRACRGRFPSGHGSRRPAMVASRAQEGTNPQRSRAISLAPSSSTRQVVKSSPDAPLQRVRRFGGCGVPRTLYRSCDWASPPAPSGVLLHRALQLWTVGPSDRSFLLRPRRRPRDRSELGAPDL